MFAPSDFARWRASLNHLLQQRRNRGIVVLSGSPDHLSRLLQAVAWPADALWLGSAEATPLRLPPVQTVVPQAGHHHLGGERSAILVDGWCGVDANAVLQLAGTLRAGGVLWWCLPPLAQWLQQPNPAMHRWCSAGLGIRTPSLFHHWLGQHLRRSPVLWVSPDDRLPSLPPEAGKTTPAPPLAFRWTEDQQAALDRAARLASADTLLLLARRGRGKSTVMAEIAHRATGRRIVVSSRKASLVTFFAHLSRRGWQRAGRNRWTHGTRAGEIRFMAPDRFIATRPDCDWLLVDEAARLTLPVLTRLLNGDMRQVLATTTEGYEGAGQGFRLRVQHWLPTGRRLQVQTLALPVRWAVDDPLERWLDRVFLPEPSTAMPEPTEDVSAVSIEPWAPETAGWERLPAVFDLLRAAHYQTRPSDLMQLLDEPGRQLWLALTADGQPVGVLWARAEGGVGPPEDGWLRGHLVAQKLARELDAPHWLRWRSLRITRIAVAPAWQGRGIGTRLVRRFIQENLSSVDFISVSCSAAPELIRFWQRCGFEKIWQGVKPHRASGVPSMILIYPAAGSL